MHRLRYMAGYLPGIIAIGAAFYFSFALLGGWSAPDHPSPNSVSSITIQATPVVATPIVINP